VIDTYTAAPDIHVLSSSFPIPGLGLVPINAFVIKGPEPILVDTGAGVQHAEFMTALRSVIDPSELRWLWLTHPDFDHIGSLQQLLADNPRLRVITNFLGVGIMGLSSPLPLDRVFLINPGETIAVGNRTLTCVRPPAFDNPATIGFYDDRSRALFSSDCFGALLQSVPQNAADLTASDLRDGQVLWATIDAPWLHKVDRQVLDKELEAIGRIAPALVLSSHLPPAPGHMLPRLLHALTAVPGAPPFVGPNQATLEQMLQAMAGGQAG
jgi:flavorubredoxin